MELNFDKEIDTLLRQTAKGESVFADGNPKSQIPNPKSQHLDADEISAFAENALPETAKQFYTAHLADCDVCRKKLSSLILLNAETEIEDVHAEEIVPISSAIPWYRKLFAFPNLAYMLGAVVLVFSGIIGFTILQSVNNSQNLQVSQSSERPNDTKEMSAEGDVVPSEMSNANMANMASNTTSFNSSNSMMSNTLMNRAAMNTNNNAVAEKPTASPKATPQIETRREDDLALSKDERKIQLDGISAGSVSEQKQTDKKETEKAAETADAAKSAPASPKPAQPSVSENQTKSDAQSAKARRKSLESNLDTTSIGNKTFNRRNNVWYDTAYNGQATTNLTRGTNEYKKLDQNLRVIVENLGGTVVVVWKEKAYRIQ